jgi:hypothetical protein
MEFAMFNYQKWMSILDRFSVEELVEELEREEREIREIDYYPAWVDKDEVKKALEMSINDIQFTIHKKTSQKEKDTNAHIPKYFYFE